MKKLLLIDAHALIHRFFHAMPPLTGPDAAPVGALYGLAALLLKIRMGEWNSGQPDYIAAAFDRPEPTFRKQEFDGYKAKRLEPVSELVAQIIASRELFARFGIACFEMPGFEADDIIGTLAKKFVAQDFQVVILSGDHDLLQLVDDERVVVDISRKGASDLTRYTEEGVKTKYGLLPKQLPDYKGLVGDASDNIPGVRGVGPKGALELLQKYGTLEAVLEDAALIPGTLGKKIEGHEDEARLSKKLATIKCDVPIEIANLDALTPAELDTKALKSYLETLGFRSLAQRLPASG